MTKDTFNSYLHSHICEYSTLYDSCGSHWQLACYMHASGKMVTFYSDLKEIIFYLSRHAHTSMGKPYVAHLVWLLQCYVM